MFDIIKENLNIITRWVARVLIVRFVIFLWLFFLLSYIFIFINHTISQNNTQSFQCEQKIDNKSPLSTQTIKWPCNEKIINKNFFDLSVSSFDDFSSFVWNNWNNIIFIIFSFVVVWQLILPPRWYDEFLDRIYFYFLDLIKNDDFLKDKVFITKNIKKWDWFIKFLIKWVNQNIHFELYVMNFSAELEMDKVNKIKWYKKLYNFLKNWTKSEYLQLQLHFEDINAEIEEKLKNDFEKKYLSNYNILPHYWDLSKLKSFLNNQTKNIWYILESKITRKDILKGEILQHSNFYDNWTTRKSIYNIFKNAIIDKKEKDLEKLNSVYINFHDLSRNDIKIMAENYIQVISYYIKNEEFLLDLKSL